MQKIDNVMNLLLNFIGVILAFLAGVSCRQLLKKPRNKVHFYVARDENGELWIYIGKPVRILGTFAGGKKGTALAYSENFSKFDLNVHDFDNLKWEDEPVEVFLNLDD